MAEPCGQLDAVPFTGTAPEGALAKALVSLELQKNPTWCLRGGQEARWYLQTPSCRQGRDKQAPRAGAGPNSAVRDWIDEITFPQLELISFKNL